MLEDNIAILDRPGTLVKCLA
jgi:hypothetical protein